MFLIKFIREIVRVYSSVKQFMLFESNNLPQCTQLNGNDVDPKSTCLKYNFLNDKLRSRVVVFSVCLNEITSYLVETLSETMCIAIAHQLDIILYCLGKVPF